jgi:enamine deaminase RidA (YjgF/YER057c/UK114 family)
LITGTGRTNFSSGLTSRDNSTGEVMHAGDPAAQTAQTLENLKLVLAEGGATLADVVKITTFICDPSPSSGRRRPRPSTGRWRARSRPCRVAARATTHACWRWRRWRADDALIAVFDAKYTYNFWRPVTAIRNAEDDLRDPGWTPFIDTPMHPEYPCAHCIVSASLGAVLEAEIGTGRSPTLSSASSTAGGAERTWQSVGDFVREVALARIYDGVHYRYSTEVGSAMGKRIGELAVRTVPRATP